jgi:integrase
MATFLGSTVTTTELKIMMILSWFQLLRVSELLQLHSSDFNITNNTLTIKRAKRQPNPTTIKLHPHAQQAFIALNRSGPLFAHRSNAWCNQQLSQLSRSLRTPDFTWHAFRHGGATSLKKQGVHIDDIAAIGRWKSNAILNYLH